MASATEDETPGAAAAESISVPEARTAGVFFRRQPFQYSAISALAALAWVLARGGLGDGVWGGLSDTAWFWIALAVPVVHQTYVWLGWRAQLGWGVFTKLFGKYDLHVWRATFEPLLIARALTLIALGLAEGHTLPLPPLVTKVAGWVFLLPALYAGYSTFRYFGVTRATGADHFRVEYRTMPFVREGAFKYTGNAMYALGFLGFWAIAFFTGSQAVLIVAGFQHAAIWVHYYCTEKPDIELIYGKAPAAE